MFKQHVNDIFKNQEEDNQKWFTYERFVAVCKPLEPRTGCMQSHRNAVALAKERGYKRVWVCEDDIVFRFTDPEKMRTAFELAEKYMEHVKASIMLGGSSFNSGLKFVGKRRDAVQSLGMPFPKEISFMSVTGRFSGTHCLCYDVAACLPILQNPKSCPEKQHLDVSLSEHMGKNRNTFSIFVMCPFIAYARDGDSDIRGGKYCEDQKYFENAENSCRKMLEKNIWWR